MRAISIIFKRELGAYLTSPVGWVIGALALFIQGILFEVMAMESGKRLSAEVLAEFFRVSCFPIAVGAIALSMRLLAEERQQGTMVLLNTAPLRDSEIVIGKYLSAFVFLAVVTLASIYMPLLVMVRGKISFAHVAVGYTGLILWGAAMLAIGVFASSLTRHQLVAGVVASVLAGLMVLFWLLAKIVDPPVKTVLSALDMFRHYDPFRQGIVHLRDIVYFLALTYFFLLLAVKTTEAKRWE